jgi:hypothetical protein
LHAAGSEGVLGRAAASVAHQLKGLAHLPEVPVGHRAGDQRRHDHVIVMLFVRGEDGAGGRSGELVMQFGKGPQVRGRRRVPDVRAQLRQGERHSGLGGSAPGLPPAAQHR